MKIVILNGRIRLVHTIEGEIAHVTVGKRTRRCTSSAHPGGSWRQSPGKKNSWEKSDPNIEPMPLSSVTVIDVDQWPTGPDVHKIEGLDMNATVELIRNHLRDSVSIYSKTAIGKRKPPEFEPSIIEEFCKDEGLPIPSKIDLEDIIKPMWQDMVPERRQGTIGSLVQRIALARDLAEGPREITDHTPEFDDGPQVGSEGGPPDVGEENHDLSLVQPTGDPAKEIKPVDVIKNPADTVESTNTKDVKPADTVESTDAKPADTPEGLPKETTGGAQEPSKEATGEAQEPLVESNGDSPKEASGEPQGPSGEVVPPGETTKTGTKKK